jgi:signal transduction histidine kinase
VIRFRGTAATLAARMSERSLDIAVAVAVFAASMALLAAGEDHIHALDVVLVALTALPLVWRRQAPLGAFVATGLASVALRAVAEPAGPPIGATLALYWMVSASDESRARTRLLAGIVIAILIAHAAAGGIGHNHFPGAELLFGTLLWGGTWLAGERTRLRRQRMAELEERAERAERLAAAEERTRIARDLHDSAGHAINVILVHAGLGRLRVEDDPDAARAAFATIETVARETVTEIDQMVSALRENGASAEVEPPAAVAALDGLVERHRAAGLQVSTRVSGDLEHLPAAVDRAAYRVLQEALTNAARHGAGSAHVVVAAGDALELTVTNPLVPDAATGDGHGLVGMRERVALLGGSLEAGPQDGRFRVHAKLPLDG